MWLITTTGTLSFLTLNSAATAVVKRHESDMYSHIIGGTNEKQLLLDTKKMMQLKFNGTEVRLCIFLQNQKVLHWHIIIHLSEILLPLDFKQGEYSDYYACYDLY